MYQEIDYGGVEGLLAKLPGVIASGAYEVKVASPHISGSLDEALSITYP